MLTKELLPDIQQRWGVLSSSNKSNHHTSSRPASHSSGQQAGTSANRSKSNGGQGNNHHKNHSNQPKNIITHHFRNSQIEVEIEEFFEDESDDEDCSSTHMSSRSSFSGASLASNNINNSRETNQSSSVRSSSSSSTSSLPSSAVRQPWRAQAQQHADLKKAKVEAHNNSRSSSNIENNSNTSNTNNATKNGGTYLHPNHQQRKSQQQQSSSSSSRETNNSHENKSSSSSSSRNNSRNKNHSRYHDRVPHPEISTLENAKGQLSKDQTKRLCSLLDEDYNVISKDGTMKLRITPRRLLHRLNKRLHDSRIHCLNTGIRLVGSGAAYVLLDELPSNASLPSKSFINDLDFCFYIPDDHHFYDILQIEEKVLLEFLHEQINIGDSMSLREVYDRFFLDSVKVDSDSPSRECWSLITIGEQGSKTIDIKFVYKSRRSWVFSADSFEIVLDPLFPHHHHHNAHNHHRHGNNQNNSNSNSKWSNRKNNNLIVGENYEIEQCNTTSPNGSPNASSLTTFSQNSVNPAAASKQSSSLSVDRDRDRDSDTSSNSSNSDSELDSISTSEAIIQVESLYGDYVDALNHLKNNLLCTKHPEEIRRGIFRYCHELAKGRNPKQEERSNLDKIFVESFVGEHVVNFEEVLSKFLVKHASSSLSCLDQLHEVFSRSTLATSSNSTLDPMSTTSDSTLESTSTVSAASDEEHQINNVAEKYLEVIDRFRTKYAEQIGEDLKLTPQTEL